MLSLVNSQGGQSCIIPSLHWEALPGVLQDMIFVYKCQGPMCCCASSRDYNCLHPETTLRLSSCIVMYYLRPPITEWQHPQITLHTICSLLENRGININNTSSWHVCRVELWSTMTFSSASFIQHPHPSFHYQSFQLPLLATSCSFLNFPNPIFFLFKLAN